MPKDQLDASSFSPDTRDFLALLHKHDVKYMIIGGEAVIYYGYVRVTGDIDFFYERTPDNTHRLFTALQEFWNGNVPGLQNEEELLQAGLIVQFGLPPNRIDLVSRIDGVDFENAWPNRLAVHIRGEGFDIPAWFLGLKDLIQNKRTVARAKDLDDLRFLDR